jgi:predicted alpha/beta superfamily hydrolase
MRDQIDFGSLTISPAMLEGALQFDMQSNVCGATYRIYVYPPKQEPPVDGFPIVYVTDGNRLFGTAAMQAELIEESVGECGTLIVGIGYPVANRREPDIRRMRDLSACAPEEEMRRDFAAILESASVTYGGADEFLRFMIEELEPALAGRFTVDRGRRALVGFSLGGLFSLYALFRFPKYFRTVVAGSPSIWWNNRSLLRALPAFRRAVELGDAVPRVLITVGALEQTRGKFGALPGISAERLEEMMRRCKMIDNARELVAELRTIQGPPGYRVQFQEFEGETHMSVVAATIGRAISFALEP